MEKMTDYEFEQFVEKLMCYFNNQPWFVDKGERLGMCWVWVHKSDLYENKEDVMRLYDDVGFEGLDEFMAVKQMEMTDYIAKEKGLKAEWLGGEYVLVDENGEQIEEKLYDVYNYR